jgi:hypothetical protein
MPHNFFWKRACIEARDHGEPSRALKMINPNRSPEPLEQQLGFSLSPVSA